MSYLYTKSGSQIKLGNPIGDPGGEGTVFEVIDKSDKCIKIYHRSDSQIDAERMEKIEYMLLNKPKLLEGTRYKICWPEELVFDGNKKFSGFLMPKAGSKSITVDKICSSSRHKNLSDSYYNKFFRGSIEGISNRFKLLCNISIAINQIHEKESYIVGDLKPVNILFDEKGFIFLIDVDSYQIYDKVVRKTFPTKVASPEYSPPEVYHPGFSVSQRKSVQWDLFGLSVLYYQILFGIHPFAASFKQPYDKCSALADKIKEGLYVHGDKCSYIHKLPDIHKNFYIIPDGIKTLFNNSLNFDISGKKRTSAEKWGKEINDIIGSKSGEIKQLQYFSHKEKQRQKQNPPVRKNYTSNFGSTTAKTNTTYTYQHTQATVNSQYNYTPTNTVTNSGQGKGIGVFLTILAIIFLTIIIISISKSKDPTKETTVSGYTSPPSVTYSQAEMTAINWIQGLGSNRASSWGIMSNKHKKAFSNKYDLFNDNEHYGGITKSHYLYIKETYSSSDYSTVEVKYDSYDPRNDKKNSGYNEYFGRYHSLFILIKKDGKWLLDDIKNKNSGFSDYRTFLHLSRYGSY